MLPFLIPENAIIAIMASFVTISVVIVAAVLMIGATSVVVMVDALVVVMAVIVRIPVVVMWFGGWEWFRYTHKSW